MFNAFKYTKQLEEVGFSREQAEIQLQVITEIVEGDLATKQDLEIFGTTLRQDVKILETNLKQDMKILETNIKQVEINIESKIQQLEYRIIIKLGTLLVIGFTTMATLMKFFLLH